MPSRPLPPPPSQPPQEISTLLPHLTLSFSLLLLLTACFRTKKKRTVPSSSPLPPHHFSYSSLRRATSNFSPSLLLGQGGFAKVYQANLKTTTTTTTQNAAVKVMDAAGSLQGEREFHNELSLCSTIHSPHIISLIGFSSDNAKRHRMALVFELMTNGSLQDCLLSRKSPQLMVWNKRHAIAVDVAKGLEYLHHSCNPPIVHGDIKPSNILLDSDFNSKIADFGLARLKSDGDCGIAIVDCPGAGAGGEETGSAFEETTEFNFSVNPSPEDFVRVTVDETPEDLERGGVLSEGDLERDSLGNGGGRRRSGRQLRSFSGKDWWLKQDNDGGGVKKDYVMEWIGSEIKNERPKSEWGGASSSSIGRSGRKKNKKGLDWWKNMEGEKDGKKKKKKKKGKGRQPREWWKEEYCEELAKKKKKKKKNHQGSISDCNDVGENWWPVDDGLYSDRNRKKRSRSRSGSVGSVDWWLEKLSGNSHDSGSEGTPRSVGGYSSTPSMRGTVCYNAPENFGEGCEASEKCDVYSFGVVLLVLVSGRRPLQFNGSPVGEYQRANLLSWAKLLARRGKLVDLVDKSVQCLDREQALLCITVALSCLQKLPHRRPSMREVVGMLCGELESPPLPVEFSPSPMRVPLKSQKKVR